MNTYKVSFIHAETQGYYVLIDADSEEEAKELFNEGRGDYDWREIKNSYEGGEISDIEVKKLPDVN